MQDTTRERTRGNPSLAVHHIPREQSSQLYAKGKNQTFKMVDAGVDIDAMARKELQALAKTFGIKANQKSVILRDLIREAIAEQEQSSLEAEVVDVEDEREQPEPLVEDNSSVSEDAESTEIQKELSHSPDAELSDSPSLPEKDEISDESEQLEETNTTGDENSSETVNEFPNVTTNENDFPDNSETVNVVPVEDVAIEEGHDGSKAPNEDTVTAGEDDETEIEIGNDDSAVGQVEEMKQEIGTKPQPSASVDKKVLPTKISFNAQKGSIKKHSHSNIYRNEKFTSKLDESFRKSNERKQVRNTNLPPKTTNRPTEQGKNLSKVQKREVPLWKVHSRDFMRKRGEDKTRDLSSNKKKPLSTKQVQRRPFGDRSNNTIGTKIGKKNIEKNDVRKIAPKPQAMSKRNEQQMKLFLERQAAGKKEKGKLVPPKSLPMSKRNEEQMKRFLERQSVGRKDRARKEEVRNYANYVR